MKDDIADEVERRRPIAMMIAHGFVKRVPASVTRDDIEQAAMIGLWKALRKPRAPETTDSMHEWYIRRRIRGEIIDELRAQDWLPRRARESGTYEHLELVRFDDLRTDTYFGWEERFALEQPSADETLAVSSEASAALAAPMPERDRRVVELIVFGGNKQSDVARDLGVSEPRITQLYARALLRMREHLLDGAPRPKNRPGGSTT